MKQNRLRALILSVGFDLRQASAGRLIRARPESYDLQDEPAIGVPQKLRDAGPHHIATRVEECQKRGPAIEAEILQVLQRQIADSALDGALKEGGGLVPDGPRFLSVALDDGRLKARIDTQPHVLDIL
jgi:hypothetical protein